ncbi:nitrate- and nitrite sensing domain-containing protein [Streptomyces cavernae]|uniref:sensor histidine kinase n=1 Tax=Streptomyces cavernae TaxID=2259034 RepID=UPI000FEB6CC7|nr:nitrate- and nitrite sensing domain-containing protein [Streptomyces cavernae]
MQGRFKRDGSASAEPEPTGGTDRGSSPPHAQNPGPAPAGEIGGSAARPGTTAGPNTTAPKPPAPTGPGSRVALRNWRISTRLVSLLALPVVAATSLGALRINQSMDDIQQLDNMKLLTDMTKQATNLAAALQDERDQSAGPLSHGASAADYEVKNVREKTDLARSAFLEGTHDIDTSGNQNLDGVRDNVVQIAQQIGELSGIRQDAYKDDGNSQQTVQAYHQLIEQLLGLSQDMAQATSNPEMIQRTRALAAFSSAKEYASTQRAVIAAALPVNDRDFGKLSQNDRQYGLSAWDNERNELASFRNIYQGDAAELIKPLTDGSATIKEADEYSERVLSQENGIQLRDKRSYKDWVDADSTKIQAMSKIEDTLLNEMEQKARELRNESEREAIISGALILLVLGISLVGAFVVARSMIRSLRRLQDTATRVAQDRLPELVKQLSESDPQDVDTSVESVGVHSKDEIGRVAAAFDDVHREAVRLAAEQALLRGNVNAMFTNLSRRSQGLIQRQLSLISELESREADPDQLSSLFKLDHLATRMRRNGENLLVLAGEEPGRRWTRPVPLVDVLRAAASEVEQYERIELAQVPATEVAGRVVNDLVHLLAELLENATSFSSPQTKVKVTGHALPDGRVLIEIHDTGIGLSPEDLAAINERLASPPTVDVSVSRRMGLFVVGRLSQRHGIRIQLRPSDSGGTTALVMLPVDVAQGGKKPAPGKPGAPAAGGPAAAQAAAGVAAARRGGAGGPALGGGASGGGPGLLGAGAAPRGQVGGGSRAALPGAGPGGPAAPGGPRGPQGGPQQGRPAPAGAGNAFGQAGPGAQNFQAPNSGRQDGGFDGFAAREPGRQDAFGGARGTSPAPQQRQGDDGGRRRPQLPPLGGPRAELPGGNPQPRTPSWSDDNAQPPVPPRPPLDAPRGHEEPDVTSRLPRIDDQQGPAATGQFPRPGHGAPQQGSGQFVRSDVYGGPTPAPTQDFSQRDSGSTGQFPVQEPASTGQFPVQDPSSTGQFPTQDPASTGQFPTQDPASTGQFPTHDPASTGQFPTQDPASTGQFPAQNPASTGQFPVQDPASTGQFALPGGREDGNTGNSTGQFERPGTSGTRGELGRPLPPRPPQPPRRTEPEALPPATGPGDGRTPVYDTLETNWFRGGGHGGGDNGSNGSSPASSAPAPQPATASASTSGNGSNGSLTSTGSWRISPNDELGRQAERVRQPAAGGVTVSGLPRRVPRANLVAGTAQQQQHQSGPQVSRSPDDVRGRLTNLRRGIQQGRQAGTGQTGSFPSPTHQQER